MTSPNVPAGAVHAGDWVLMNNGKRTRAYVGVKRGTDEANLCVIGELGASGDVLRRTARLYVGGGIIGVDAVGLRRLSADAPTPAHGIGSLRDPEGRLLEP